MAKVCQGQRGSQGARKGQRAVWPECRRSGEVGLEEDRRIRVPLGTLLKAAGNLGILLLGSARAAWHSQRLLQLPRGEGRNYKFWRRDWPLLESK